MVVASLTFWEVLENDLRPSALGRAEGAGLQGTRVLRGVSERERERAREREKGHPAGRPVHLLDRARERHTPVQGGCRDGIPIAGRAIAA